MPCDILRKMFPTELSNEEIEMSSMYVPAVFEKAPPVCSIDKISVEELFLDKLPGEIELEILNFLPVCELMKCRRISSKWCQIIETIKIEQGIKDAYFVPSYDQLKVAHDEEGVKYCRKGETYYLTPRSVALYMQMGGPASAPAIMGDDFSDVGDGFSDFSMGDDFPDYDGFGLASTGDDYSDFEYRHSYYSGSFYGFY